MGNRKYLPDGAEVVLVEKLKTGFLVNHIMFDGDDEYVIEEPCFVEILFDRVPLVKYDEKIIALKDEIDGLTATRNELKDNIRSIREDEKSRLQKYKQYEQLKRLDDFLDGKITHYVSFSYRLEIIELTDAKNKSGYDRDELKLLTLFGRTNGDLQWRINSYSDGSGGWENVVPCTSYNEALTMLQDYVGAQMNETPNVFIITAAKKYNLKISTDYVKRFQVREIESLEKKIQSSLEDTKKLKKKKAILLKSGRAVLGK